MTFRTLNLAAAFLCAVLAVLLVALPDVIYFIFNLSGDELGNFLAKRAGMLFLGVATLLFFSRNAQASDARSAISLGLWVAMAGLALVGLYEFFRGYAGLGILLAIATETSFAVCYFAVWRFDRALNT